MFCFCNDYCIKNYELNQYQYDEIMNNIKNSGTYTITTLVKQNRQNDFMNFLIVLADKHYQKKRFWSSESLYDTLMKQDFPGVIHIIKQTELQTKS